LVPWDWTPGFLIGGPFAFPSGGEEPFSVFEPDGEQRFENRSDPKMDG
jgi:hypothetical protein